MELNLNRTAVDRRAGRRDLDGTVKLCGALNGEQVAAAVLVDMDMVNGSGSKAASLSTRTVPMAASLRARPGLSRPRLSRRPVTRQLPVSAEAAST